MWATASVLHAKLRCFCQILLPSKVFLLCTSAVAQALSSGSSLSCGLFLEGAAAIPACCAEEVVLAVHTHGSRPEAT